MGNKDKLLQDRRTLLLLAARGHGGVQATDLDSTSHDGVQAPVHVDLDGCRDQRHVTYEVLLEASPMES